MPHGTANAMIVSLMARCAALYFARQNIPPAGPPEIGEARYRCVCSSVVRSAATQDAKASEERFERARDGERN